MAPQKNLREALEVLLARHLATHRKRKNQIPKPEKAVQVEKPRLSARQERVVQFHRAVRKTRYEQAIALVSQGMSQKETASTVGISHRTIQQWLSASAFPERKRREQASQLDPYLPSALELWSQGCHKITRIYEELKRQGYKGSYATVHTHLAPLRHSKQTQLQASALQGSPRVSSRQAASLLVRQPEKLTAEEQETLASLRALHPDIEQAYGFAQEFMQMMRTRTGEKLDVWVGSGGEKSFKRSTLLRHRSISG